MAQKQKKGASCPLCSAQFTCGRKLSMHFFQAHKDVCEVFLCPNHTKNECPFYWGLPTSHGVGAGIFMQYMQSHIKKGCTG